MNRIDFPFQDWTPPSWSPVEEPKVDEQLGAVRHTMNHGTHTYIYIVVISDL